MPMTGLATLVQALALVAGDDLVEQALLCPRVVQIVVDDVVAERGPGHRPPLQRLDCLTERRRKALRIRLVRVPLQRRGQLEALLDTVEAGRDQGRKGQVWSDVAARNPRLDAGGGPVADDPKAARPVVVAPRQRGRRPRPCRVPLVRVDRRGEEERELARARDPTGEELLEELGLAGKRVLPVTPETRVDVTRAADPRV